ncbi:hypothetical protein GGX14DRAFT_661370 [Mycena pura]|uniref:Uncharacterized protein n=1 Tax=Mycena pura TaxID=153505 RepID=A0AAD6V3P3_9AGAR|nr:hypothetical protein GGX14DRAFT_661370 [Mycena pura]
MIMIALFTTFGASPHGRAVYAWRPRQIASGFTSICITTRRTYGAVCWLERANLPADRLSAHRLCHIGAPRGGRCTCQWTPRREAAQMLAPLEPGWLSRRRRRRSRSARNAAVLSDPLGPTCLERWPPSPSSAAPCIAMPRIVDDTTKTTRATARALFRASDTHVHTVPQDRSLRGLRGGCVDEIQRDTSHTDGGKTEGWRAIGVTKYGGGRSDREQSYTIKDRTPNINGHKN